MEVTYRWRTLSDNGLSCIAGEMAHRIIEWIMPAGHDRTPGLKARSRACIRRCRIAFDLYLDGDLEQKIDDFVTCHKHLRNDVSMRTITRADVRFGRGKAIWLEGDKSNATPLKPDVFLPQARRPAVLLHDVGRPSGAAICPELAATRQAEFVS